MGLRKVFDFLTGGFRALLLLALPVGVVVGIFAGISNPYAIGYALILGVLALIVGVPFALIVAAKWTRDRPYQQFGVAAAIPLGLLAWAGAREVYDYVVESGAKPEYLSRTVSNPTGKLGHLVFVGTSGCRDECYDILLNGIAETFSSGYLNNNGGSERLFERAYRLGRGQECNIDASVVVASQEYYQSRGIFDSCVMDSKLDKRDTTIAIRGFQYDRNIIIRPFGLSWPVVAQSVTNWELGPELMRWVWLAAEFRETCREAFYCHELCPNAHRNQQ